jgi:hypothetical protein
MTALDFRVFDELTSSSINLETADVNMNSEENYELGWVLG